MGQRNLEKAFRLSEESAEAQGTYSKQNRYVGAKPYRTGSKRDRHSVGVKQKIKQR